MPWSIFSCKRATHLISDSLDRNLTWRETLVMRTHLCICWVCRRFNQQIKKLHQITVGQTERLRELLTSVTLSDESRKRIQDKMNEEIQKKDKNPDETNE